MTVAAVPHSAPGVTRALVYDFVLAHFREHGVEPTCAEVARGVGMRSRSAAHAHLQRLEADGLLVTRTVRSYRAYGPPECDR